MIVAPSLWWSIIAGVEDTGMNATGAVVLWRALCLCLTDIIQIPVRSGPMNIHLVGDVGMTYVLVSIASIYAVFDMERVRLT